MVFILLNVQYFVKILIVNGLENILTFNFKIGLEVGFWEHQEEEVFFSSLFTATTKTTIMRIEVSVIVNCLCNLTAIDSSGIEAIERYIIKKRSVESSISFSRDFATSNASLVNYT